MKRSNTILLSLLPCLLSAPLGAQTQIGGGACNTLSLNGTYMMTLTGRQISPSGSFASVYQADGSVTFNGQSKVSLTLTVNTLKGVAAQSYSGTYVVQANCAGTVSITTGDTATFSLLIYNQGTNFLLAGSDANYNFTGGGSLQSANACSVAKLAGVYSMNATGYSISNSAVGGIVDGIGLIQFDGKGAATLSFNIAGAASAASPLSATGTYTMASTCLGTASLADSKGNAYSVAIVGTGVSGVAVNGFDVLLGQAGKLTVLGAGHALYGQPTALVVTPSEALQREDGLAMDDLAKEGERA